METLNPKEIIEYIDGKLKGPVVPLDVEREVIQLIEAYTKAKSIEFSEWIYKNKYTQVPLLRIWKSEGGANYTLPYLFQKFTQES